MKLSYKIGKLFSKGCWKSAYYHAERVLLNLKLSILSVTHGTVKSQFTLTPENILKSFDCPDFKQIQKDYGTTERVDDNRKYISFPLVWLEKNITRIKAVGLHHGVQKNVLDIGCGVGYFLYINQQLGHKALGLDVDEDPMFGKMINILGVNRRICRINAYEPMPDFGMKFDLVTAHLICFNGHKNYAAPLWTSKEWKFFLNDLSKQLTPDAEVYFELNCEFDGTFMTPELRAWFENELHAAVASSGRNVYLKHRIFKAGVANPEVPATAGAR